MCKFCRVSLGIACLALGFHNPLQAADPTGSDRTDRLGSSMFPALVQ